VADFPIDPSELKRGLDMIRGALGAPGQDALAALDRLTVEVARLNANVERALPVLESIDQHVKRAMPVVDSFQQAEKGIQALRRSMRRPPSQGPKDPPETTAPGGGKPEPEGGKPEPGDGDPPPPAPLR
jgi:hypothetical protein